MITYIRLALLIVYHMFYDDSKHTINYDTRDGNYNSNDDHNHNNHNNNNNNTNTHAHTHTNSAIPYTI